jgi:hypothetical protein
LNTKNTTGVSGRAAAKAGQMLGAQYIVTGNFDLAGENYQRRLKLLEVSSAAIRLMYNEMILNDVTVISLMGRQAGSTTAVSSEMD